MNNRLLLILIGGLLLLALILVGVLAACSPRGGGDSSGSGEITLTYWRVFDDQDKLEPLIEEYRKGHGNIKIDYKKLTYEEYEKVLNEAIAAGRGPDMFSVQNTWMPEFFSKIEPVPVESYAIEDYRKEFYPAVADTIQDERIYGIPITMDVLMMFVNPALLSRVDIDEPPKFWEDLVGKPGDAAKPGILRALNNRQGDVFNQSTIILGNTRVARSADILSLMMLQQRTNMVNEDKTQALFNLTQDVEGKEVHLGTEALRFYTSFANPATANYSWNARQGDGVTAFAQGRAAMMLGYAYHAPILERINPELTYNIVPVPQIAGTDPVNYASYWAETVSKSSPHKKEAWDFVRFVTDRLGAELYLENVRAIPGRRDMSAREKLGGDVQKQLETAATWYKGDAQKADEYFVTMINQVLGGEDPQRAIDASANRTTTMLRELKGTAP